MTLEQVPACRITEVLADAKTLVSPALRSAVDDLPAPMRKLAFYHFGWADRPGVRCMDGMGKTLRSALVLLACEAVGGEAQWAVPAAVAVELVHNASLVHDDVIDGDRLRRHRTALWAACGVPAAILLGDALFFLAVQVVARQGPEPLAHTGVIWLTGAVQTLITGEYADTTLEHHDGGILLSDVTDMATAKTASLIATACALGALAGGAGTDRVEHLRWYGTHVGQAFQLVDDLLGIWGDSTVTGKPSLADLQARKKSLPVAAALAADNDAARELARLYTIPTPFSPGQLHRVAHLIDQAGGREWATAQARHHTELALSHLRAAAPEPVAEAALTALAQHAVNRTC